MTEVERQEIKAKLIALGFWGEGERGDPTIGFQDAMTLYDRMAARLAQDHFQVSSWVGTDSLSRYAQVVCGRIVYELAAADTYTECICFAAMALHEFLKEHPECVTSQK